MRFLGKLINYKGVCHFIFDHSGLFGPVMIVNGAVFLNRNNGFSDQRDELPNSHAKR